MADDKFKKFKDKYAKGDMKVQAGIPPIPGPGGIGKAAFGPVMRAAVQYGKMGMEKARPFLDKPVREVAKEAVEATTKANAKSGNKANFLKGGSKGGSKGGAKGEPKPLNRGAERLQKKMEGWRAGNAVKRASKEKDPGSMAARARAVSRKPESRPPDGGSRALVKREDRMPAVQAGREVAKQESRALATQGSRAVTRREGGGGGGPTMRVNANSKLLAGSVAGASAIEPARKTFARTSREGGGGNVAKGPVNRREGGGGNVAKGPVNRREGGGGNVAPKAPMPKMRPSDLKTNKGTSKPNSTASQGKKPNKPTKYPAQKQPKQESFADSVRRADSGDSFIQRKRGNRLRSFK